MDAFDSSSESEDWSESDDGFGSAGSDPEEIIISRMYRVPQGQFRAPSPPPALPLFPVGPVFDLDDSHRPHPFPYSRNVTTSGFDTLNRRNSRIRYFLRNATSFDGNSLVNDEEYLPKRITGMAIRQRKIIYFVQWFGKGDTSIPVDAELMRNNYPHLVVKFHQKRTLKPNRYTTL